MRRETGSWFTKSIAKLESLDKNATQSRTPDSTGCSVDEYNFSISELLLPSARPQTPKEQYDSAVTALVARTKALSREATKGRNWMNVTTDDWASAAAKFLPTVIHFRDAEGCFSLAWDLMMKIAARCHSVEDDEYSSGFGGSKPIFDKFDAVLMSLIKRRIVEGPVAGYSYNCITATYDDLKPTQEHLNSYGVSGYISGSILELWRQILM